MRRPNANPPAGAAPGILGVTVLILIAGCSPQAPDLAPFAEAIRWLGICLVISSLIWAVGLVLFGRSRK